MLTLESPTTTALKKLSSFLRETTGITLKITSMSYDDLYAQIHRLQEDSDYDLIRMDTAWLEGLGQKIYMPLSQTDLPDSESVKTIAETAHSCYTHSGNTPCALPFDPSVQILLYRRDLFEDAVLQRAYYEAFKETLEVPQTMEQWHRVARFFTRGFRSDSPTLYGTSVTAGNPTIAACDFLPHYLAKNGELYDSHGTALLDTPLMHTNIMKKTGAAMIPGGRPHSGGIFRLR